MSPKIQAVKSALANMKKKGIYNPMKGAHSNPAVQSEEHTPGVKASLPLKSNTGAGSVKSNSPFFGKPKGTVENPTEESDPSTTVKRVVKKAKPFYKKAKTRGA